MPRSGGTANGNVQMAKPRILKEEEQVTSADTSLSSDEVEEEVVVDDSESKFEKFTIEWRQEQQWKTAFEHTMFYRIEKEIDIHKLQLGSNKDDHSLFLDKCIKADGLHISTFMMPTTKRRSLSGRM